MPLLKEDGVWGLSMFENRSTLRTVLYMNILAALVHNCGRLFDLSDLSDYIANCVENILHVFMIFSSHIDFADS